MNRPKSIYTPRIGSELFETAVMKTDEAFLFVKSAVEGGSDKQTALDDMHMIDDLLHMQRLHLAVHGQIKRTKAGNFRKGTSIYDAFNDIINGRVEAEKELKTIQTQE